LERIFRIRNRLQDVPGVLDAIEESCRGDGQTKEIALDMRLVAEEVLTNIVKYAHGNTGDHPVELRLSAASGSVRMEFRDNGAPFNPLEAPAPDLETRMDEREIGGFGVHLVKSLVDDARYAREGDCNVLILMKRA
jgi:anti-sigma regulatory factor (Ser/Thr protein kinase)